MAPAYEYWDQGTGDSCTYTVTTASGGTACDNSPFWVYDTGTSANSYYTWTGDAPYVYGNYGRVIYRPVYTTPSVWVNEPVDRPSWNVERVIEFPPPTPEQIAELQRASEELLRQEEERQQRYQQQREAERVARLSKEQKAEGLIKEILGELQYTAFKKHGYIDIPSGFDPMKRYRVRPNRMIGVVKKVNDTWVEQAVALCIHPSHDYIDGDHVATKIALCKFEEREMLRVANVHQRAA